MKPEDKLKRQATYVRRTHKTKDDFLRWWREQDTFKKQAAEEQITQADHADLRAVMVWADDGGQISPTNVEGAAQPRE